MPCNDFIAYAVCLKAQCLTGAVRSYGQYMYDACAQNGLWFILTTVLPVLEPKPLLWCTRLLLHCTLLHPVLLTVVALVQQPAGLIGG